MALLESAQYIKFSDTVPGTYKFSDINGKLPSDGTTARNDADFSGVPLGGFSYDVLVEGQGSVDPATKTVDGFDYDVAVGTVTFRIYPKRLGAIGQVS